MDRSRRNKSDFEKLLFAEREVNILTRENIILKRKIEDLKADNKDLLYVINNPTKHQFHREILRQLNDKARGYKTKYDVLLSEFIKLKQELINQV